MDDNKDDKKPKGSIKMFTDKELVEGKKYMNAWSGGTYFKRGDQIIYRTTEGLEIPYQPRPNDRFYEVD